MHVAISLDSYHYSPDGYCVALTRMKTPLLNSGKYVGNLHVGGYCGECVHDEIKCNS